jgi:hypothetical protein
MTTSREELTGMRYPMLYPITQCERGNNVIAGSGRNDRAVRLHRPYLKFNVQNSSAILPSVACLPEW